VPRSPGAARVLAEAVRGELRGVLEQRASFVPLDAEQIRRGETLCGKRIGSSRSAWQLKARAGMLALRLRAWIREP